MEGERIARSLSLYHDKYRTQLRQKGPEEAASEDGRKKSVDLVKKMIPPKCTDGRLIELPMMNDYTSESVKGEMSDFETTGVLKPMHLCPGCQGGQMNNPKIVTSGVGNILEKWEMAYCVLSDVMEKSREQSGEELSEEQQAMTNLHRCYSFDDLRPPTYKTEGHTQENFIDTLNEGTEKISIHGQTLAPILASKGEGTMLIYILGSLILARNKLVFYGPRVQCPERKVPFQKSIQDLEEIIHAIEVQVQEYYTTMICTTIIHEGEGQDWADNKPFFEGERLSTAIQFWGHHLQCLRSDLYGALPPGVARPLLIKVFGDSLGVLTVRYCQIKPSSRRLAQYRADITAMLLVAHDMLLSMVDSLGQLFNPTVHNNNLVARAVHAKCTILACALTTVGCPVKVLGRTLETTAGDKYMISTSSLPPIDQGNRLQPLEKNSEETRLTHWLHLLLPGVYASGKLNEINLYRLSAQSFAYVCGRMAATQPEPNWSLLVRLCLAKDLEFPKLILRNFGAFVPGITGEPFVKSMREGCGHLYCVKRCLGTADIYWPQVVASGALYVVMHGNLEKSGLVKVLSPLLKKLSRSSWEVLNASVMWNVKKPIWFQGLLDLLEPYFIPIIDDLLDDVEAGRTWTLSHVPDAIKKMNENILDVAHIVPASFFQACELIEGLLPDDIQPICDSVVVHLFISGIYSIINKLVPVFRDWKMQREKVDFLVAVGEKLCHLDSSTEMQKLEGLTDASSNVKTEKAHEWDGQNVTNELLSAPAGQEALKALYRFISYNSEWLQNAVGVTATISGGSGTQEADGDPILGGGQRPKLIPWGEKTFKEPEAVEAALQIGACSIRYSSLFDYAHSWEESIRHLSRDANPSLVVRLLKNRPESTDPDGVDPGERASFRQVLAYFERNMHEKTSSLER